MSPSTSNVIESQILHTTTARTLHAHNFTKSSTQATHALTDVLSRYLTLLAGTCAQYAQHAGRTGVTVRDALAALEDIGVSVEELHEYVEGEARELVRYTGQTAKRAEELAELKAGLAEGLKQDHSDAIQLVYAPVPDIDFLQLSSSDDEVSETQVREVSSAIPKEREIGMGYEAPRALDPYTDLITPPSSPHLPPSPISPTPARKRARTANWKAPEYVPDFLPPFPGHAASPQGSPSHQPVSLTLESTNINLSAAVPVPVLSLPSPTAALTLEVKPEAKQSQPSQTQPPPPPPPPPRPPSPTLPTSTSTFSSYFSSIPYEHSSLASVTEWHLPNPPPEVSPLSSTSTLPALLSSHAFLQSSALSAPSLQPPNPLRHGLAMMLLGVSSRAYSPAATLFASSHTNTCAPIPRRAAPPVAHAVPLDKDKRNKLPVPPPDWYGRSVAGPVAIVDSTSVQGSRIPILARTVLPPAVIARATRLIPPPPLERNNQPLLYGPPVPAPWNSGASAAEKGVKSGKDKDKDKNEEDEEEDKVLSDAHLFATWDYDPKDFRAGLPMARRGSKMGVGLGANGSTQQLKRKRSDSMVPSRRGSEAGPAILRVKTER